MLGLMMDRPLLISDLLRYANLNHSGTEIVSVMGDGDRHRTTYGKTYKRVCQLAAALVALGVEKGDRLGTLAWNDYRHYEIYFGVSGIGAVCHTLNPRLFSEHLAYIIQHAGDRWIFADPMFAPLLNAVAPELSALEGVVFLCSESEFPAVAQAVTFPFESLCYETLVASGTADLEWPSFDENTASSLCYTSGTTGHPKGVLYSHRSTVLHSLAISLPDAVGVSMRDTVLAVVPMFHVNAWGMPYSATMVGAKLVFPGPKMADGEALQKLIEEEGVTLALGVPTIWQALLQYLENSGKDLGPLQRTVVGGAACPPSMIREFRDRYGVETLHGWGMTETSPIGTINTSRPEWLELAPEERLTKASKQGHGVFGVEMKIVDDAGRDLPWDGEAFGALLVRGPWVCKEYFRLDEADETHTADGWFNTGDVATIDGDGYMQIVDRTKDVIKSGGEWISSIELENLAMGHPAVAEAAVIAVAHPKWTERPLLIVVLKEGAAATREDMLEHLAGQVADWWLPDDVTFVTELPHTSTGKLQKKELRLQYQDYVLPGVRPES